VSLAARPVLVAGIPRSGTTWAAQVLACARGWPLRHEPDNEKQHLAAFRAKRELGRFPVLRPGESAPAYEDLWRRALSGVPEDGSRRTRVATRLWCEVSQEQREAALHGRPTPGLRLALTLTGGGTPPGRDGDRADVVVKTVHAPLSLEWLTQRFPTVRTVVVLRHPANVLSSWRELGLPDQDRQLDRHPRVRNGLVAAWGVPPPGEDALSRAAWHVCLLTAALLDAAGRQPQWLLVEHEDFCRGPVERFAALAGELGMAWNDRAEQYVRASDTIGTGFAVQRKAGEQPGRWRSRLTAAEVGVLADVMRQFPLLDRWTDDVAHPVTGLGQG
jgi:hypothetical protein